MLSFLLTLPLLVHTALLHDLHAFPKHRLLFLHGRPVANHTAERWLRAGLPGGEREFLDQWPPPNRIDAAGDAHDEERPLGSDHQSRVHVPEPSPALEHMRLGPSKSYLCLIPPAPTLPPPSPDDPQPPATPSHSWSLLQPLSDSCLYHRQAWFTYSYCHNLHVRQFRELPTTYPHPPGARVVEEDPEWESYTLGKSPLAHSVDRHPPLNDDLALVNHLELARQGAGQRYLVQRWSDGTVCDKTGRPREIEVQFHCSMTMTDTILFVKETRTCEYVLVIHTPRLCGEPGFKSRLEQMPEAAIRCREVVQSVDGADATLPDALHPVERKTRKSVPAPPPPPPPLSQQQQADDAGQDGTHGAKDGGAAGAAVDTRDRAQDTAKLLRKALEALLGRGAVEDVAMYEVQQGEEEGEFYFTVSDPDAQQAVAEEEEGRGEWEGGQPHGAHEQEAQQGQQGEPVARGRGDTLEQALRAAGFEVKGRKPQEPLSEDDGDEDKKRGERGEHDEL